MEGHDIDLHIDQIVLGSVHSPTLKTHMPQETELGSIIQTDQK